MLDQILGWLRGSLNTVTSKLLTRALLRRAETLERATDTPMVVVAPHQDDETFGCGGIIVQKRQRDVPVTVVFVSDGGGSARDPGVTREAIIKIREQEARRATAILGVLPEQVVFLNYQDTQLGYLDAAARAELVARLKTIIDQHPRVEVYVTHHRDFHPDHEAACRLVEEALAGFSGEARLLEYPIWLRWMGKFYRNLQWSDFPGLVKVPIQDALPVKLKAIEAYHSQITKLEPAHLQCFEQPWEILVERSRPKPSANHPA